LAHSARTPSRTSVNSSCSLPRFFIGPFYATAPGA
jgi:hypothetical protein